MAYHPVYQISLVSGLLEKRLAPNHELLILAREIDWEGIERDLMRYYKPGGRPAKSIRLMVGLHLLKHRFNVSDAAVVQEVQENLYWMMFCGIEGQLGSADWPEPLHSTTLTKFRNRIGAAGTARIEALINQHLVGQGEIRPRSQLVDTTVQEKHIAYPRDTHLLEHGRRWIVKTVAQLEQLGARIWLYPFSDQAKRIWTGLNKWGRKNRDKLKEGTQELIDIARKVIEQVPAVVECGVEAMTQAVQARWERLTEQLQRYKQLLERVISQAEARWAGRHLKGKVLSLHEPHVVAIAKGKSERPYEYGVKVCLSIDAHGYVVSHQEYADARADLRTLDAALAGWEQVCGRPAQELGADRGFYTSRPSRRVQQLAHVAIPPTGKIPHPDKRKSYFRRLQRRRAAVEAVISHLKNDHRLDRSRYKGFEGDRMNVSWGVMAWNLKKWARKCQQRAKKQQQQEKVAA